MVKAAKHMLWLAIMPNLYALLPDDVAYYSQVVKQQALEQALDILNNPCESKCLKYTGKKLITCIDYASKEEARETFAKMSYQARVEYLLSMNLLEYKRFLDAFENEKQWEESLNTLDEHERALMPKSLLEQLIMIRDTWISCSERRVGIYSKGKKDPDALDIAAWRNKTLEKLELMQLKYPMLFRWLEERFTEQKIAMFCALEKETLRKKRIDT